MERSGKTSVSSELVVLCTRVNNSCELMISYTFYACKIVSHKNIHEILTMNNELHEGCQKIALIYFSVLCDDSQLEILRILYHPLLFVTCTQCTIRVDT
jgi:hypothetical protein